MSAPEHEYLVTGADAFPFDELRANRAWPHATVDSDKLHTSGRRSIRLESHQPPNVASWQASGWTVTE